MKDQFQIPSKSEGALVQA